MCGPSNGDIKNSSHTSGQDNRILLHKLRALKERIHLIPETEVVNHTSWRGNYKSTADNEERDIGMKSVVTHTPTLNRVPDNDDLIQTITISFQCCAPGCEWKKEELMQALASIHLWLHYEANHYVSDAQQGRLQKIDRSVIRTRFSHEDFNFSGNNGTDTP